MLMFPALLILTFRYFDDYRIMALNYYSCVAMPLAAASIVISIIIVL